MDDLTVRVRGFTEFQRACKRAPRDLRLEVRHALIAVAEPVKADAERLAQARISRIGVPWSQMRIGVTQRVVYIAPKQRGSKARNDRRFRRPNLFNLLMGRSMEPALAANEQRIVREMEHVIDTVGRRWESV